MVSITRILLNVMLFQKFGLIETLKQVLLSQTPTQPLIGNEKNAMRYTVPFHSIRHPL
jgi:hypothetical protein